LRVAKCNADADLQGELYRRHFVVSLGPEAIARLRGHVRDCDLDAVLGAWIREQVLRFPLPAPKSGRRSATVVRPKRKGLRNRSS
jgi:hypothetical protein